jgi:plasmid stability protein
MALMASITIRQLDVLVVRELRARAAEHGRTMEEEARPILCNGIIHGGKETALTPFLVMRQRMAEARIRGVNLPIRRRSVTRKSPTFD